MRKEDRVFDRVGDKIKKIAKIVFWIGAVLAGLSFMLFVFIGYNVPNIMMICLVVGLVVSFIEIFFAWLGCLYVYAFGQMVDDTELLKNTAGRIATTLNLIDKKIMQEKEKKITSPFVEERVIRPEKKIGQDLLKEDYPEKALRAKDKEKEVSGEAESAVEDERKVCCPSCKAELNFMGFTTDDLQEENCPFCGAKLV